MFCFNSLLFNLLLLFSPSPFDRMGIILLVSGVSLNWLPRQKSVKQSHFFFISRNVPPLALAGLQPCRRNGLKTRLVPSLRHSYIRIDKLNHPTEVDRALDSEFIKIQLLSLACYWMHNIEIATELGEAELGTRRYTADRLRNDQWSL